jgi:transposase InsO family protein
LPDLTGDRPAQKQCTPYPLSSFPIDIAEVRTEEGKLSLLVAIDRVRTFAYAELHTKSNQALDAAFLRHLIAAVPYKIYTVLTDNGIQFTNRTRDQNAFAYLFDCVCQESDIDHRLTRTNQPWTNGQVARMNRTLKETTVKKYYYQVPAEASIRASCLPINHDLVRILRETTKSPAFSI